MEHRTYHQEKDIENVKKLRELQQELPRWLRDYFRGIEYTKESRTRIAYAIDLKIFFDYIQQHNPMYKNMNVQDIPIDILSKLKATDIEEYLEYLKLYKNEEGKEITNNERGLRRKLASLRSMYHYYHKNRIITENPVIQVDMPKIHDKAIIRLEANEVAELLDIVESGSTLSENQQLYHEKLKTRDLALLTLLLGTGIRVSECVGLDITDVDFDNDRIKIVRKGGYESFVYFGDEVREALLDYLEERKNIIATENDENALFLSSRKQRISVRSVQVLVKKYAQTVTTLKKITPHKLRSTYGTNLYQETGDIYLVADVLGHRDVNTTKKHYAAIEDGRRRLARNKVRLREKE
ncbi:tyrosine-type recombinase/integrase [Clostridium sp. Marseille-P299]|uniref:tyrosine-type recombinase/integrase n=1 Tax=Clostridium sp. Marseille-P299 TaxID=1805477 RepID=UPI00082B4DB7|nr:tyrosine-type recombinase/integrase [Clostridium sp. Marseille-P299]